MDRNREGRRATVGASNGVSRRRHRTGSLRDSPDEDGQVEVQESMPRLRERGLKKDRDRERDRDRDRSGRSKRRGEKLIIGNNREDGGDDTSEESVDEEDGEYDEDVQASVRTLPPNPVQSSGHHNQQRKILPPVASRNFRAPALKPADEMIGVSIPRKARSASTKRLHEWISGGGGGIGGDIIHQQESSSPVRQSPAAQVSPSSSNASVRKKMKPNMSKSRPPKSSKPATNPEELEIEIAEVLYGLRTQQQPQGHNTKEIASGDTVKIDSKEVDKTSSDAKSRTSSPSSNNPSIFPQSSPLLPQNSSSSGAPMSAVAQKRKRPRHVSENLGNFSSLGSPVSSTTMKMEIDQHLNTEISSHSLEKNSGTVAENSRTSPVPALLPELLPQGEMKPVMSALSESNPSAKEALDLRFFMSTKEGVTSQKESPPAGLITDRGDVAATSAGKKVMNIERQKEEKFQIDLMAPEFRSALDSEDVVHLAAAGNSSLKGLANVNDEITDKKGDTEVKISIGESADVEKAKAINQEAVDSRNSVLKKENVVDLKLLSRPDRGGINMRSDNSSMLQQEIPKPPLQPTKVAGDELKKENTAEHNSFPLPMAVASWPGGLRPVGYMAPLQGLVSMEGSIMSPTPIQPFFSQPRGKRCATHYYIAQNIHYIQQLMKPPAAVGSSPIFGAKPLNFNIMPPAEFNGNITGRSTSTGISSNSLQDKGQEIITMFPSNSEKDRGLLQTDQRKQQPVLLQPTVPPGPPNNILHGPPFAFPFNQQQAAARPSSAKSSATPVNLASNSVTASGSTTATTSAATTMNFNYSNICPSEAQYLAIFQNNGYPFPMAAPPNYRGTHPQAMPMFNGSFYPSQMIHPSQLQQPQPQFQQSSGSSSSQKHLQGQQHQRPQVSSVNGGSGAGNLQNFPLHKTRMPPQQPNHQLSGRENELGGKDNSTPSTADSRVSPSSSASVSVYGQNFSMSVHPLSFAVVTPTSGGGNQNEKKQQHQQPQQQATVKTGSESHPPQTFAMSFVPPNSSDNSSQERKGGHAVKSPPSIAFSRSEVPDVSGGSASPSNITAVATDSSGRMVNAAPGSFNISSSHLSPLYQNQKLDQQQLIKLHKLQQHHHDQQQQQHQIAAAAAARGKTPAPTNGSTYPENLKFQNVLANFPQPYKQNASTGTSGSSPPPQWKNSNVKTPNSRVPSSLSSSTTPLKNHVQNQSRLQQISFGSTQKPSMVATNAQPQPPNNNPSPPSAAVGSPTHSSVSRGTSGSPRSITASTSHKTSQAPVQTQKPSILGNPSNITAAAASSGANSQMQQQQQQQTQQFSKQAMQQAQQLFFSNHHYMQQPQGGPHSMGSTVSASSGYYLQRKRPDQHQQQQHQSQQQQQHQSQQQQQQQQQQQHQSQQPPGSTGMMMLCPVSVAGSGSSDPAKTAGGVSVSKGHSSGNMHQLLPNGFSYTVQAGVQAKPPDQKQPAA